MPFERIAVLLAPLAFAISCASAATAHRPTFESTPETDSVTFIKFDAAGLAPAPGSMMALCGSVQVTIDRGFRYFRMRDRVRHGNAAGSWRLEHFSSPPPGSSVVSPSGSPFAELDDDALFDAQELAVPCRSLGANPTGSPRSPSPNAVDQTPNRSLQRMPRG